MAYSCGYPDTMNKKGGDSPLYQADINYKKSDRLNKRLDRLEGRLTKSGIKKEEGGAYTGNPGYTGDSRREIRYRKTDRKAGAAAGYGNMDEAKSTAKLDKTLAKKGYKRSPLNKTAAWTRKEGKDPKGGLNEKGVASYKRDNPGSNLQTAVTTKPSKLKKGSKAANRRKSFCARMGGMPGAMMKDGKPTRKKLALDKWNC